MVALLLLLHLQHRVMLGGRAEQVAQQGTSRSRAFHEHLAPVVSNATDRYHAGAAAYEHSAMTLSL